MKKVFIVLLTLLFLLFPITSIALTGGPDIDGYNFVDSNSEGAPAFVWDEVGQDEGIGIPKENWPNLQYIDIGFDFTFYGNTYSHIYISPWGYLTFNNFKLASCYVDPIPTATKDGRDDNLIAGVWSYLLPST